MTSAYVAVAATLIGLPFGPRALHPKQSSDAKSVSKPHREKTLNAPLSL
jgi:hypothetical protein